MLEETHSLTERIAQLAHAQYGVVSSPRSSPARPDLRWATAAPASIEESSAAGNGLPSTCPCQGPLRLRCREWSPTCPATSTHATSPVISGSRPPPGRGRSGISRPCSPRRACGGRSSRPRSSGSSIGSGSGRCSQPRRAVRAPGWSGGWEVDFLWERERFVVEADGGDHLSRRQRDRDNERDVALGRAGFLVRRYGWVPVHERRSITAEIAAILAERGG